MTLPTTPLQQTIYNKYLIKYFLYDPQKDIVTRELQEQNQSSLQQLAELVAHHIETGPVVVRYLEEKELCLPVSRSPGGSLTYSSARDRHRLTPPIKSPVSSRISLRGSGKYKISTESENIQ